MLVAGHHRTQIGKKGFQSLSAVSMNKSKSEHCLQTKDEEFHLKHP